MANLSLAEIKEFSGEDNIDSIKKLIASKKNFTRVKSLRQCSSLQKLDLSFNQLISVKDILTCLSLTWVNISHNLITSLKGIGHLKNLVVLNASHNSLNDTGDLSDLKVLKALVLNNNQLSAISGLSSLSSLNTLILSHNKFESIDVSSLSQLTKLSISHNLLTSVPNTKTNFLLLELRLTSNKITVIPPTIQLNTRLQIIDLGQNAITKLKSIESISYVKKLKNVNLSGNPIKPDIYRDKLIQWLKQLHILDGTKLAKSEHKKATNETPPVTLAVSEQLTHEETTTDISDGDMMHSDITSDKKEKDYDEESMSNDHQKPVILKKRSRGKSGVISVETVSKKIKKTHDKKDDIFDVKTSVASWND